MNTITNKLKQLFSNAGIVVRIVVAEFVDYTYLTISAAGMDDDTMIVVRNKSLYGAIEWLTFKTGAVEVSRRKIGYSLTLVVMSDGRELLVDTTNEEYEDYRASTVASAARSL